MRAAEYIKILLIKENMTITKLAQKFSEHSGKKLSRSNLSNKLKRKTINFSEVLTICEIIGYDLNFVKKQ